jgi:hypothetical protein
MRKTVWLAVGSSAGVIAAAGLAPFLTHQGGLAIQDLWAKIRPSHLLWVALIFGAAGAVPLLVPLVPFRRAFQRALRRSPAPTRRRTAGPEHRVVRIARRKGLSQDAVRILLWRERERPAKRRPGSGGRGTSFRPARSSAAPAARRIRTGDARQGQSTWVRVA